MHPIHPSPNRVFKIKGTGHSGLTERKCPMGIRPEEDTRLAGGKSWGFKAEKHLGEKTQRILENIKHKG